MTKTTVIIFFILALIGGTYLRCFYLPKKREKEHFKYLEEVRQQQHERNKRKYWYLLREIGQFMWKYRRLELKQFDYKEKLINNLHKKISLAHEFQNKLNIESQKREKLNNAVNIYFKDFYIDIPIAKVDAMIKDIHSGHPKFYKREKMQAAIDYIDVAIKESRYEDIVLLVEKKISLLKMKKQI